MTTVTELTDIAHPGGSTFPSIGRSGSQVKEPSEVHPHPLDLLIIRRPVSLAEDAARETLAFS